MGKPDKWSSCPAAAFYWLTAIERRGSASHLSTGGVAGHSVHLEMRRTRTVDRPAADIAIPAPSYKKDRPFSSKCDIRMSPPKSWLLPSASKVLFGRWLMTGGPRGSSRHCVFKRLLSGTFQSAAVCQMR